MLSLSSYLVLSLLSVAAPQAPVSTPLPPLPAVALETFPAAAREAIAREYTTALARPSDADAVGALARVLHSWEQWEAAHHAYGRASVLQPSAFEWAYLNGVVLQRLARHDDAIQTLRRALQIRADYLPARLRLAEALLDGGQLDQSETILEPLTSVPETQPAAHVGLGRIHAARGRLEEAIRHLERAVALFPELGAAHYALALAYRSAGRPDDAQRAAAQHLRYGSRWPRLDDPLVSSVSALREDARATLLRGIRLAEAGDLAGAIDGHEQALAADPSLTGAHPTLVTLYARRQQWAKAAEHYRAAVARGEGEAQLHYDYGVVLGLQTEFDAAADAYRKALAANPLHAPARNNLGQILERTRDFEGAEQEYRRAVEAQPTFRLARFNLGRMLLVRGEVQQAIAEFERLQQPVDEETPRYLFALSTAVVRAGRMAEGLRLGADSQRLAEQFGQAELARAIAGELSKLK